MKCFKLDYNGDVVIKNHEIEMINGNGLTQQTCQTVIGTNLEEWFLNEEEGINFKTILTKNPNFDAIRDEVQSGLRQVDESFVIDEFNYEITNRALNISFVATNDQGDAVKGGASYGE